MAQQFNHRIIRVSKQIEKEQLLELLGGDWPDSGLSEYWPSGFSFDSVDHYELENGHLVPYAGGLPAPGPDFKLEMI